MTVPRPDPASPPLSPRPPLSCFVRTLNEERNIAACVTAALAVADEVIVVDSGSTDGTKAAAEAAGARVVTQPWLGWGRQKRAAEDLCRHAYVLDIDGDELVSPALAADIRALFAAGTPPRPVYGLRLVTVPYGGETWPRFQSVWRNKLYDRSVIRAPDDADWDQFVPPRGMRIGRLRGELVHRGYRDFAHLTDKLNRTSSGLARPNKGKLGVALRVLFGWPLYFLRHLLIRGYVRGGVYGIALAAIAAHGRWLRDAKTYELLVTNPTDRK